VSLAADANASSNFQRSTHKSEVRRFDKYRSEGDFQIRNRAADIEHLPCQVLTYIETM
jgi:hypothetical protein